MILIVVFYALAPCGRGEYQYSLSPYISISPLLDDEVNNFPHETIVKNTGIDSYCMYVAI